MKGISVVINVISGEVSVLPKCLNSIKDLASEIVIVDMTEGFEVKAIAKKFKAKVFPHEFVNYVEPVRNFGISKVVNDWVLILDPDEEIGSELAKELRRIVEGQEADFVRIARKNIVFGKWLKHSRWWPDHNIRFFKKGFVVWNEIIHSVPITTGRDLNVEASKDLAIIHHHYSSIDEYLEKMTRYTSVQAKLKVKDGLEFRWQYLVEKPIGEFLSRFFAGEGYKDGIHGIALSGLQAFSEFVLYLKVWQLTKFKEEELEVVALVKEVRKVEKELNYWTADLLLHKFGGITERIRRKFKI